MTGDNNAETEGQSVKVMDRRERWMRTVRDGQMKGGEEEGGLTLINEPLSVCDVRKGPRVVVMVTSSVTGLLGP